MNRSLRSNIVKTYQIWLIDCWIKILIIDLASERFLKCHWLDRKLLTSSNSINKYKVEKCKDLRPWFLSKIFHKCEELHSEKRKGRTSNNKIIFRKWKKKIHMPIWLLLRELNWKNRWKQTSKCNLWNRGLWMQRKITILPIKWN